MAGTSLHWSKAPGEPRWLVRRRGIPQYVGDLKVCRRCELAKMPDAFTLDTKRTDGRAPYCSDCTAGANAARRAADPVLARERARDAQRRFRQTEKGVANRKKHGPAGSKKYLATPEGRAKQAGRMRLQYALKIGRLVRPTTCSECGKTEKPQAHHPRGYDGDAALDVEWLCRSCHGKRHRS